jgi:hypothetical protein
MILLQEAELQNREAGEAGNLWQWRGEQRERKGGVNGGIERDKDDGE